MAVTVGDAIQYLEQFPPETPIYWGIDELPCWITCAEATSEELENLFAKEHGWGGREFLYIISPSHVKKLEGLIEGYKSDARSFNRLRHSFWSRLKFLFTRGTKV